MAKALNCCRLSIYNWMEEDAKFKQAYEDVEESILDLTESQMLNLIKGVPELDEQGKFIGWLEKPDTTLIIFKLKTKGKKRGYVERTETDITSKGQQIQAPVEMTEFYKKLNENLNRISGQVADG